MQPLLACDDARLARITKPGRGKKGQQRKTKPREDRGVIFLFSRTTLSSRHFFRLFVSSVPLFSRSPIPTLHAASLPPFNPGARFVTSAMLSASLSPRLAAASRPATTTMWSSSSLSSIKASLCRLASSSAAPRQLTPLIAPLRSSTIIARATEDDKVRNRGREGDK